MLVAKTMAAEYLTSELLNDANADITIIEAKKNVIILPP